MFRPRESQATDRIEAARRDRAASLDLSGLRLEQLPASLWSLSWLESLSLAGNRLTALPPAIAGLTALRRLDLSDNGRLTRIPPEIGDLAALEALNLRGTGLDQLPDSIGRLSALTWLDLAKTPLLALPASLGRVLSLRWVDLDGCSDRSARRAAANGVPGLLYWLRTGGAKARLSVDAITDVMVPPHHAAVIKAYQAASEQTAIDGLTIDLSDLDIDALPYDLYGDRNLRLHTKALVARNNRITEIPAWIDGLRSLQHLNLAGNRIDTIRTVKGPPLGLSSLNLARNRLTRIRPGGLIGETLIALDLSGNPLEAFPDAVWRCGALQTLRIAGVTAVKTAWGIKHLTRLRSLDASGLGLTEVPDSLFGLPDLAELSLANNALEMVPDSLARLAGLRRLDLSGNRLRALPTSLATPRPGLELRLDGNPLDGAPARTPHVEMRPPPPPPPLDVQPVPPEPPPVRVTPPPPPPPVPDVPVREVKLVLVGQGGVGKSSLLAALRGEPFVEQRAQTHGLRRAPVSLPERDGKAAIRLHAWDFGGQNTYRVSQQFFFSADAVYVLVWNPRQGARAGDLDGWLDLISRRGDDNARVVIVGTHSAWPGEMLDLAGLEARFPGMIAGHVVVDSKSGAGLDDLRALIHETVLAASGDDASMPARFVSLREAILTAPSPVLTPASFGALCGAHGIDPTAGEGLLAWLHAAGQIVWFRNRMGLDALIIREPEWLCRAVAYILDDGAARAAEGVVTDARIRAIWAGGNPDGEAFAEPFHGVLLRLMELFEVAVALADQPGSYVVPELLPARRPADVSDAAATPEPGDRQLAMEWRFAAEPVGLIPWLISRSAHLTVGRRWRAGLTIDRPDQDATALVEMTDRHRLRLVVRAPAPHYLYHLLRDQIDALIDSRFDGYGAEAAALCPTGTAPTCRGEGRFSEQRLSQARDRGRTEIVCPHCDTDIGVDALAPAFSVTSLGTAEAAIETSGADLVAGLRSRLDSIKSDQAVTQALLAQVIGGQSDLVAGQAGLRHMVAEVRADLAEGMRTLIKLASDEVRDCPRLFTMEPVDMGAWSPRRLFESRYVLTLWCEHAGAEHPVSTARYEVPETKTWLVQAAPYMRRVAQLLRWAGPLSQATDLILDEVMPPGTGTNIGRVGFIATETIDSLQGRPGVGGLSEVEGAGLRALRALLMDHLDRQHVFGGMRRVTTRTGDTVWTCADHFGEASRAAAVALEEVV